MGLTDVVKEVIEDFNKLKNPSGIWKTLEKKMKEEGFKSEYKEIIGEINIFKAYNLLKVLDALDYLKEENNSWYSDKTRFRLINALSEIDEIEEVIKALGESGYKPTMKSLFTFAHLPEESLKIFETLAKDKLYKKYGLISKSLKNLGYKGVSSYAKSKSLVDMQQLECLINIASLEGDVSGAIYVLISNGYKIDEAGGLDKLDIIRIKKIVEEDKKERSEEKGGIPVYLYNTSHVALFQDYFNSLEIEKKKSVLRSILDYEVKENTNNQIKEWLEKDYESLLREVGFED